MALVAVGEKSVGTIIVFMGEFVSA